MTDRELMQQVLDDICGARLCEINSMSSRHEMFRLLDKAITALRDRLAQPEQEPVAVAWMYEARHIDSAWGTAVSLKHPGPEDRYVRGVTPLYTAPPTRRPLTDSEADALAHEMVKGGKSVQWLVRAIERAHKITGGNDE